MLGWLEGVEVDVFWYIMHGFVERGLEERERGKGREGERERGWEGLVQ